MTMIRDFREEDLGRIVSFKKESVKLNFPDSPFNEEMFRNILLKGIKANPESVKVAEVDGEVAGYIWFKLVESAVGVFGRLEHLFVDKRFRNSGIGKELMLAAEEYLRDKGLKKVKLSVTSTNETAISLYKKIGYAVKRHVMEKDL